MTKSGREDAERQRSPVWHIEIRQHEKYAFVIDPDSRPKVRYIKTHRCVYHVPCVVCGARIGKPCVGVRGEAVTEVHPSRRDVFYKRVTEEAAAEQFGPARRKGAWRRQGA